MQNKSNAGLYVGLTVLLLGVTTFFVVKAMNRPKPLPLPTPEDGKKKKGTIVVGELESLGYGDKMQQVVDFKSGGSSIFQNLMDRLSFKPTTKTYGVDTERLKKINQTAIQMGMGAATRQPYKLNVELGITTK